MYEPPSCVWSGDCQRREAEEDELPSSETLSLYWVHVKLACLIFSWPPRCTSPFHITSLVFRLCVYRNHRVGSTVTVQWVPPWPHSSRQLNPAQELFKQLKVWGWNSRLVVSPSSRLTYQYILWHIGHAGRSNSNLYLRPIRRQQPEYSIFIVGSTPRSSKIHFFCAPRPFHTKQKW